MSKFNWDNFEDAKSSGFDWDAHPDAEQPQKPEQISQAQAALRGVAQGGSFGFSDEIAGAGEALGSLVGLRGVGAGAPSDIHFETPEEKAQAFGDVYTKTRDKQREAETQSQKQHPITYAASEIAGSIPMAAATGGAGVGAKGAIVGGGAMGLGNSKAKDLEGLAADTVEGMGWGLGGHALASGVTSAVGKGINAVAKPPEAVKALARGANEGAKAAAETGSQIPGIHTVQKALGAVKGALSEVKGQAEANVEFKELAHQAMKVLRPGEVGNVGNLSADEAVLAALMQDGPNPVKTWFAQKSAMLNPGAGSAEEYEKLLNMGSEARSAGRSFDARTAAKELIPDVEQAQELFKKARGDRYNALQNEARQTFEPRSVGGVLDELSGAMQDAQHPLISGKARTVIAGVKDMLTEGKGLRAHGLTEGALDDVPHEELFNRLQKGREVVDHNVKWANSQGDSESEGLLKGVRDAFDRALKTSPEKVEADALYSQGKRVEDAFFGATEFKKNGQIDIDEGKLSRLFGGTDGAKRFQAALPDMREYANQPALGQEFTQKMNGVLDQLEKKIGVASDKAAVNGFRYKAGPSSPAIERMQSATGKNSLLKDAANAPSGFLNQADEFNKFVQSKTGTPFPKLPVEQQLKVTKFWTWLKNNQDAAQPAIDKAWTKLVGP